MSHDWAKLADNVQRAGGDDALLAKHLAVLLTLAIIDANQVPMFKAPKLVEVVLRECELGRTKQIQLAATYI